MINVEPFLEIVRVVLASGYLKDDKPLSAVFVSDPESGKTEIIRKYCLQTDGVFYTTDATAYGIIRDTNHLRDFETGKIKHIVIPDLLTCMARRESTVNTLIHFMNSLIEEGVVDMSTFAVKVRQDDKSRGKLNIRAGLITSITTKMFYDKRYRWSSIGFLSRVLPISYAYDFDTKLRILDYIEKQEYLKEELEKLKFKKRPVKVTLPYEYGKAVEPYSLNLSKAQEMYGFRLQKQFQTMLKSIAYLRDSNVVENQDFEKFRELVKYINLEFNKV